VNAGGDQVCPVCQWPDNGDAVCGECGWQLLGDYILGAATWADQSDLDTRLADRQRRHDLRAAARAAGVAGNRDPDVLTRLAGLARGGPVVREQVDQAAEEVDAEDPSVAETSAGITFALTRLVVGKTEAIAFVEVGLDAISVRTLVAGALGVLTPLVGDGLPTSLVGDGLPWTDVLPLLPDDQDLRRLRMAGGIGMLRGAVRDTATPAALISVLDEAIRPVLDRLMAGATAAAVASRADSGPGLWSNLPPRSPHQVDVVLVRRMVRWPVVDAAIARARTALRPIAEIVVPADAGDLAAVVDDLAGRAPLRHGYDLILVDADASSGAVTVKPRKLFAAGAAVLPGTKPTVVIPVAAVPGHAADRLALPIVARRGPVTDYRDPDLLRDLRPLVAMAALDGTIPETTELRVTLRGPGRLDVQHARGVLPAHAVRVGWPELITGVPKQLPPTNRSAMGGLDLVVLVELGGAEGTVATRVRLARDLVDMFRNASAARIAVVGYRDHFGRHRVDAIGKTDEDQEALVVGCPLVEPAGARSVLRRADRWHEVPVGDHHAAPIEDALQIVAGPKWEWRLGTRHVLLVIGGRPPHPAKELRYGEGMLPCPHRFSWQRALDRLRAAQTVERFAVLDRREDPGSSYARQAWQELGADGVYPAGSITAARLARLVSPVPRADAFEICLARYAGAAPSKSRVGEAG